MDSNPFALNRKSQGMQEEAKQAKDMFKARIQKPNNKWNFSNSMGSQSGEE